MSNVISNRHWADLTDEYVHTDTQYQNIAVSEGEVWRTITNGVFDTIEIPVGTTLYTFDRQSSTRLYKLVDWQNAFNTATGSYVLNYYVNNSGTALTSTYYGYIDIPVTSGEIYRISDVFSAKGDTIPCRGVFYNVNDTFVKQIKFVNPPVLPYQWNDVIVPPTATKMRVNFLQSLNGVADGLNRCCINRAVTPTKVYADNSRFEGKVWSAFGDSTTMYGEWEQMVSHALTLRYVNHGYGGGTIADNGRNNETSYPVLCADAKLNAIMADNPDIVTILGGANDKGLDIPLGNYSDMYATMGTEDKTTYIGAYSYIIKKLLSLNPKLQIVVITCAGSRGDPANTTTGLLNLDYAITSQKIADFFGLKCIFIRGTMRLNTYTLRLLTRDDVHWSFRGSDCVAQDVEREIRTTNWFAS